MRTRASTYVRTYSDCFCPVSSGFRARACHRPFGGVSPGTCVRILKGLNVIAAISCGVAFFCSPLLFIVLTQPESSWVSLIADNMYILLYANAGGLEIHWE